MSPTRSYEEDDLPLRRYSERRSEPADRELTLGTPTILGIFFLLALICAAFFGFGYSMGRKSIHPVDTSASDAVPSSPSDATSSPKPAAGSLAAQPSVPDSAAPSVPAQPVTVALQSTRTVTPADGAIVGDKLPTPTQPAPTPAPAASFMVQVAAVSTQDLADIEVAALKKQGFDVQVRHEPQDKLLHVQIGPFPDRKSAEAMRQRVLADGFNAIVK